MAGFLLPFQRAEAVQSRLARPGADFADVESMEHLVPLVNQAHLPLGEGGPLDRKSVV